MSGLTQPRIVVTAMGALSPVGGNAEQTTASVKAAITAFSEYQYLYCTPKDPEWDDDLPLYVAAVPAIESYVTGLARFIELAIPPLTETIAKAKLKRQSLASTGLFIALPQFNEVTIKLGLDKLLLPQLLKRTSLQFNKAHIANEGRIGMFSLISKAIPLLISGELNHCIVGGVDTHLITEHLALLDQHWRVKSARNTDGFIPGEAAAMLMLETEAHAKTRGATPLAVLGAVGAGQEPEIFASEKVSTGHGLTCALNAALAETKDYTVNHAYCDFNGESYYAFELGLIMSRLGNAFSNVKSLCHPADCYGDIGSASGGLLIACATNEFLKNPTKKQHALLWTSLDNGKRMALTLESYKA
jgi:3-oxoacyl-[acyl-carrier-protein] synthase-1